MTRVALLLTALVGAPAWAHQSPPEQLLRQLRSVVQSDPDRFLANIIQMLFRLSTEGVLTAQEAHAPRQTELAERRSNFLRAWLGFDLDGNFAIDAHEMAALRVGLSGERRATLETLLALADTDADGAIAQSELVAHADAGFQRHRTDSTTEIDTLLAFDRDGDGGCYS